MDQEAILRTLGFNPSASMYDESTDISAVGRAVTINFSGYSEYTPIRVYSETIINNAHLEPNKSRDRRT